MVQNYSNGISKHYHGARGIILFLDHPLSMHIIKNGYKTGRCAVMLSLILRPSGREGVGDGEPGYVMLGRCFNPFKIV